MKRMPNHGSRAVATLAWNLAINTVETDTRALGLSLFFAMTVGMTFVPQTALAQSQPLGGQVAPAGALGATQVGLAQAMGDPVQRLEQRLHELEQEVKELRNQRSVTPVLIPNAAAAQGSTPNAAASAPSASSADAVNSAAAEAASEPFAWGDFTWVNGSSRQTSRLLATKYFTPQIDIDANYTYSLNRPIDNTIVGSTATARHNELSLAFLGIGGDAQIGNARGRLFLQFGTRSTIVPHNDVTALRGQGDLNAVYRYLSEAYAGYHFNKLHGINLDVGLFCSYVGLFSYTEFDNWGYQASFTSDNTPWFFNGARLQIFPTDRFKIELWLINGWQSYGKFNQLPGFGYQLHYAPREWIKLVSSGYVGTDTQGSSGRVRFHSDTSMLLRYFNRPDARGLSRAALSATLDVGFEEGDGVAAFRGTGTLGNCTAQTPCEQDFLSAMAYSMLWFWKNQLGVMVGGGFMRNPGRYLVLIPTGVAATTFDTRPGTQFFGWDVSANASWFPTENITFRLEVSHHDVSVPYYAGPGGVTGPDGYKCGGVYDPDGTIRTCVPPGWTPDLVNAETKVILATMFRL